MTKEMRFFIYLLENYARYKGTTGDRVLRLLEEKQLRSFIYNMYEIYHSEALENALEDMDRLLEGSCPVKGI